MTALTLLIYTLSVFTLVCSDLSTSVDDSADFMRSGVGVDEDTPGPPVLNIEARISRDVNKHPNWFPRPVITVQQKERTGAKSEGRGWGVGAKSEGRGWGIEDTVAYSGRYFSYELFEADKDLKNIQATIQIREVSSKNIVDWLVVTSRKASEGLHVVTLEGLPQASHVNRVFHIAVTYPLSAGYTDVFQIKVKSGDEWSEDVTTEQLRTGGATGGVTGGAVVCSRDSSLTRASVTINTHSHSLTVQHKLNLLKKLSKSLSLDITELYVMEDVKESAQYLDDTLVAGPGDSELGEGGMIVGWVVGCGYVDHRHMNILEALERLAYDGRLRDDVGYPVAGWYVTNRKPSSARGRSHRRLTVQPTAVLLYPTATPPDRVQSASHLTSTPPESVEGISYVTAAPTVKERDNLHPTAKTSIKMKDHEVERLELQRETKNRVMNNVQDVLPSQKTNNFQSTLTLESSRFSAVKSTTITRQSILVTPTRSGQVTPSSSAQVNQISAHTQTFTVAQPAVESMSTLQPSIALLSYKISTTTPLINEALRKTVTTAYVRTSDPAITTSTVSWKISDHSQIKLNTQRVLSSEIEIKQGNSNQSNPKSELNFNNNNNSLSKGEDKLSDRSFYSSTFAGVEKNTDNNLARDVTNGLAIQQKAETFEKSLIKASEGLLNNSIYHTDKNIDRDLTTVDILSYDTEKSSTSSKELKDSTNPTTTVPLVIESHVEEIRQDYTARVFTVNLENSRTTESGPQNEARQIINSDKNNHSKETTAKNSDLIGRPTNSILTLNNKMHFHEYDDVHAVKPEIRPSTESIPSTSMSEISSDNEEAREREWILGRATKPQTTVSTTDKPYNERSEDRKAKPVETNPAHRSIESQKKDIETRREVSKDESVDVSILNDRRKGKKRKKLPHRTQHEVNHPPVVRRPLAQLNVTVGSVLIHKFHSDMFYDQEDGGTENLKLVFLAAARSLLKGSLSQENDWLYGAQRWERENERLDGLTIPPNSWIKFNRTLQMLYGLPLDDDVGRHQYVIAAVDSHDRLAKNRFEVRVHERPRQDNLQHEFKVKFDESYARAVRDVEMRISLAAGLSVALGDADTGNMAGIRLTEGSLEYSWSNKSLLARPGCPSAELQHLIDKIFDHQHHRVDDRFVEALEPYRVIGASFTAGEACRGYLTDVSAAVRPDVVPASRDPTLDVRSEPVGAALDQNDENILLYVMIPLVALAAFLFLVLIFCIIIHCQRQKRQGRLNKKIKSGDGLRVPVIFADEMQPLSESGRGAWRGEDAALRSSIRPVLADELRSPSRPPGYAASLIGSRHSTLKSTKGMRVNDEHARSCSPIVRASDGYHESQSSSDKSSIPSPSAYLIRRSSSGTYRGPPAYEPPAYYQYDIEESSDSVEGTGEEGESVSRFMRGGEARDSQRQHLL